MRKLIAAGTAILLSLSACSPKEATGITIQTPQGPVQGVTSPDNIQNIMGIPYAAPPVGELRWRPPAAAPTWTQTRAATQFSAECMQNQTSGGEFFDRMLDGHGLSGPKKATIKAFVNAQKPPAISEDCLYLNVRTPNIAGDGSVKGDPLPVMVWIHGGSHQFGSGNSDLYQSDALPQKGVVLVTLNYRLGPFGYLAHPALSADDPRGVSGNYGTLDQIAALKWVRDNIAAYGGDPNNVTIFGESAGGWSVTEMMASPLAKGLFHKAIGQSGASTYHLGQMDNEGVGWPGGYETAAKFDKNAGLDNPSAADLRALSADAVMTAGGWDIADGLHHLRDGVVFPDNVGISFQNGTFNAVPTLFGYNTDEGTIFFNDASKPGVWLDSFDRTDALKQREAFLPHYGEKTDYLLETYGLSNAETVERGIIDMSGDEIFGVNVRYVTRQNEKTGQPAWLYTFGRVPPSPKQTLGAFHVAEIFFVFGSHEKALGLSKSDEALTELMQNYWVNFAKTGNPNGDGLPNWPAHQGENWMQFGGNNDLQTGSKKGHHRQKLDALETALMKKLDALRTLQDTPVTTDESPAAGEQ